MVNLCSINSLVYSLYELETILLARTNLYCCFSIFVVVSVSIDCARGTTKFVSKFIRLLSSETTIISFVYFYLGRNYFLFVRVLRGETLNFQVPTILYLIVVCAQYFSCFFYHFNRIEVKFLTIFYNNWRYQLKRIIFRLYFAHFKFIFVFVPLQNIILTI